MNSPRSYRCNFGSPVQLTGRLDDPAWERVPWSEAFVDILGVAIPPLETRSKMLWDEDFFYVGAWLDEPCVWATLTEHDSVIFQDNDFEVFIDPDGDAQNYFEFEVNAFGTTWDLFLARPYRDSGSADNSWESDAKVAVWVDGKINDPATVDHGWGVEIAFPWSCFAQGGMPLPPDPGQSWRINFSRVQWHTEVLEGQIMKIPGLPEENWVWSPQGVVDMHQPEQWGSVQFVRD